MFKKVYNIFLERMRKKIYKYQFIKYHRDTQDPEIMSMIEYIRETGQFAMMNCKPASHYSAEEVVVRYDEGISSPYIVHESKKLYFPSTINEEEIKNLYVALLKEQDENSPHRYFSKNDIEYITHYKETGGKIRIFEFGAMEGMFSLKLCDLADEIHIFECDTEWIGALKSTFLPWQDKVTIVNKYVSDKDDDDHVSLDSYLEGKSFEGLNIVKMDIEGAEIAALHGMERFMQRVQNFKLYVCTYHRQRDEEIVREICKDYQIETNKGYFCFYVDPEYGEPYVRGLSQSLCKPPN